MHALLHPPPPNPPPHTFRSKDLKKEVLPDVRVGGLDKLLNLWCEVPGHVQRGDRTQGAQRQTLHTAIFQRSDLVLLYANSNPH
jgi:hypothetical protein